MENNEPEPIRVLVKWQDRTFAAPLAELEPVDASEDTQQAVEDWRYWVGSRYSF